MMKPAVCLVAVACVTAAPLLVKAQTFVSIASCDDLPASPISQDTVLELTAKEVSAPSLSLRLHPRADL